MYRNPKYRKCFIEQDAWMILFFLIGTLGLLLAANWFCGQL